MNYYTKYMPPPPPPPPPPSSLLCTPHILTHPSPLTLYPSHTHQEVRDSLLFPRLVDPLMVSFLPHSAPLTSSHTPYTLTTHTDLASFPGRMGGEKTAWYPLLAQAPQFLLYFRKIVRCIRCHSTWIISGPNIQGLIYVHAQVKKLLQSKSIVQKGDPSIPLLSSVM